MITAEKLVKLHYILRENDANGSVIESTYEGKMLKFIFGQGQMIPMFEEKIEGLKEGDKFEFIIPSDQAYGPVNPSAVMDLDINIFQYHGKIDYEMLKVGNKIPMSDSNGSRLEGLVKEVNDTHVKMDFNHPLAGMDLYFAGEVTRVRDARESDYNQSCGSGGCGCGSGEGHNHDGGGCGCSTEGHDHQGGGGGCGCH